MSINAFPVKQFFITTITKDIHLIDALLDLFDNSIDGFIQNSSLKEGLIKFDYTSDTIVLSDNCGGIKKKDMENTVFRFGSLKEQEDRTIGIFGIGLKRALFKLGREIFFESDDGKDYYSLKIDGKWIDDPDNWTLEFESESKSKGEAFTKIVIKDIYKNISAEMAGSKFENLLISRIENAYSPFLREKVDIIINGNTVLPKVYRLLYDGENFAPAHKKRKIQEVDVEYFAGFTNNVSKEDKLFGWFIFCNDRLILGNDTSDKTGWGDVNGTAGKNYHYPWDNRFIGLAFFRSNNPYLLPWQSTKDDIQKDSPIYREAQVEMKALTNKFVGFIRLSGATRLPDTDQAIGKAIFEGVDDETLEFFSDEMSGLLPELSGEPFAKALTADKIFTGIHYYKKINAVKRVKKKLGEPYMSNKKMGETLFDYFIRLEGIEDDS